MEQGKAAFLASCRERGAADIQSFDKDASASAVTEAFQGTSLFGGGGISIWYDCPFLPIKRGGRSRSKLSKEETWFLEKMAQMSEENGLLFYTKGKLDTGCAFFKAVKEIADVVEGEPVTEKNIMPYIEQFLQKKRKNLTFTAQHALRVLFQP